MLILFPPSDSSIPKEGEGSTTLVSTPAVILQLQLINAWLAAKGKSIPALVLERTRKSDGGIVCSNVDETQGSWHRKANAGMDLSRTCLLMISDGRMEKFGGSQRSQQRSASAAARDREMREAEAFAGGRKQDLGDSTRG